MCIFTSHCMDLAISILSDPEFSYSLLLLRESTLPIIYEFPQTCFWIWVTFSCSKCEFCASESDILSMDDNVESEAFADCQSESEVGFSSME
jgi:hypothetical protein